MELSWEDFILWLESRYPRHAAPGAPQIGGTVVLRQPGALLVRVDLGDGPQVVNVPSASWQHFAVGADVLLSRQGVGFGFRGRTSSSVSTFFSDEPSGFVPPPYPSFDSPQRPASLGFPHVPLLLDPDLAADRAHEAQFGEVVVTASPSPRSMVLDSGPVIGTASLGGALLIDQVARAVYPGPQAVASLTPVGAAIAGITVYPTRNGVPAWGVTRDQAQAGLPEQGIQTVPITDTSGNSTAPTGVLPRYDLLDLRDAQFSRSYGDGVTFAGGTVPATQTGGVYDSGQRLLAQVGVTAHLRDNDPSGGAIRDRTLTAQRFQYRYVGHVITLTGGTQAFSTGQAGQLYAEGIGALSAYAWTGTTFQPAQATNPPTRQQIGLTGNTVTGTSTGGDTQVLSTPYTDLWVQVFADTVAAGAQDAETYRRHFLSSAVEVWGDARACSGLASGNVHDLTGGADLRVNGRTYTGGSWAALRVGLAIWVLHLGSVLTREIVGGAASTCTLAELMTLCRRLELTPIRLAVGALHASWPHDRAVLETSGDTLHLTAWQPWRDATRREWADARSGRPKKAALILSTTVLPPTPPLGLALADVARTAQWDAVPRNGSPHLLPTQAQTYSEAQGWQVSAAALTALAKPLEYPGTVGILDDSSSVSGKLRVTYPAAPWAAAQRRLVLSCRVRTPIRAMTVQGQTIIPTVLGREVQAQAGALIVPRGWYAALLNVPLPYDPTQPSTIELDTRGLRLSRLLLSLVGPESGGTDS